MEFIFKTYSSMLLNNMDVIHNKILASDYFFFLAIQIHLLKNVVILCNYVYDNRLNDLIIRTQVGDV